MWKITVLIYYAYHKLVISYLNMRKGSFGEGEG